MTRNAQSQVPDLIRLQIDLEGADTASVNHLETLILNALPHLGLNAALTRVPLASGAQQGHARAALAGEAGLIDPQTPAALLTPDPLLADGAYVSAWVWVEGLPQPLTEKRLGLILDDTGRIDADDAYAARALAFVQARCGEGAALSTPQVTALLDELDAQGSPERKTP